MLDIEHSDNIDRIDSIDTGNQSITAYVCDMAKLYGATPERDEFDPRETWERETAIGAVTEAFSVLADGIGVTGFQLADEASSLLWGFVNTLDAQIRRLERSIDRISPELRGPAEGTGRNRDQVAGTGTPDGPCPEPGRATRRLRGDEGRGSCSVPRADRRDVAAPDRIPHQPLRCSDFRIDRCAGLHAGPRECEGEGEPARRNA